jgi:hypothetical protein
MSFICIFALFFQRVQIPFALIDMPAKIWLNKAINEGSGDGGADGMLFEQFSAG